jgi:hypothetical protein
MLMLPEKRPSYPHSVDLNSRRTSAPGRDCSPTLSMPPVPRYPGKASVQSPKVPVQGGDVSAGGGGVQRICPVPGYQQMQKDKEDQEQAHTVNEGDS